MYLNYRHLCREGKGETLCGIHATGAQVWWYWAHQYQEDDGSPWCSDCVAWLSTFELLSGISL